MSPRMTNPSLVVPDALQPLLDLSDAINKAGVPQRTLDLVRLRISQINGRVYTFPDDLWKSGDADGRLLLVADWREAPDFDAAERAALALAEAASRLDGREDPVPDEIWDEAARHYDEKALGALVMQIGLVNLWNCVNVSTRQAPADWR
ncbi:carboxymuconolactone decarboxylase family protein [Spirillospora sp. NPDC029432]|uniref:carboxymuconolactone decarboxylase family protein n=1 Tax=Spirillospora sp. NPDC029432 TaxID=3154599 RepID=UPI0034561133